MGIMERKLREKEERRTIILEKAKELILERGILALSMQDIADAVELSKATLYLYFENKEAILAEIGSLAAEDFVAYVNARIAPSDSGLEALRKLWEANLRMYGESNDIFILVGIADYIDPTFAIDRPGAEPRPASPLGAICDLVTGILARGVADGTLDPAIDPARIARTILLVGTAIIDDVARLPREDRDARRIVEELRSVFGILLRGLAAPGTDRAALDLPAP